MGDLDPAQGDDQAPARGCQMGRRHAGRPRQPPRGPHAPSLSKRRIYALHHLRQQRPGIDRLRRYERLCRSPQPGHDPPLLANSGQDEGGGPARIGKSVSLASETLVWARTGFPLRSRQPHPLNGRAVEFDDERQAADFSVPAWFGPEVTNEDHFRKSTLAVAGAPTIEEVEVNNAAVIALVEALESAPRLKSRSTANLGVASLSASDDADRTQPVRLPPVLRLPLPTKLPDVGVAELDPRVTEVMDGVAKALEHAPTQQHGVSAETHVDIRR